LSIVMQDLPSVPPAITVHGVTHTGPVGRELDRLALEEEPTVADTAGEWYERITGRVVSLARGDVGRRHRPHDVHSIDRETGDRAAGGRGQCQGKALCP